MATISIDAPESLMKSIEEVIKKGLYESTEGFLESAVARHLAAVFPESAIGSGCEALPLVEQPEILDFDGDYLPQVYEPFDNTLFGLFTRNIHSPEGRQLLEDRIVPELRRRRITLKRGVHTRTPTGVTFCERRLNRTEDRVLFVTVFAHTSGRIRITHMDGSEKVYDPGRDAYIVFWDHTIRVSYDGHNLSLIWERW